MNAAEYQDHFSAVATKYAAYRPRYPRALAESLAHLVEPGTAWDIGCGSGQLSTTLADFFARVIATDPSQQQLDAATPHPKVEYRRAPAEASGLPDASIDLAVAAQAAHWFDWPKFVEEVGRVTKPGGVIALVAYQDVLVEGADDPALAPYKALVEDYWPPRRVHIDNGYRDLVLPFTPLPAPAIELAAMWTAEELAGYISSWSATSAYQKQHGTAAFAQMVHDLVESWRGERRRVHWPMFVRLYRR